MCNDKSKYKSCFGEGPDGAGYIRRKSDNSVLIKGTLINGLWWCSLEDVMVPTQVNADGDVISYANARMVNKALRLHIACGHMGFQQLRKSVEEGVIIVDDNITEIEWVEAAQFCNTCAKGKSKNKIPKMGTGREAEYMYEKLYIDVFSWKPIERTSKIKYMALIVDGKTRTRWGLPLRHKSDIYDQLKLWFHSHVGITEQKVREVIIPKPTPELIKGIVWQSDNAAELNSHRLVDLLNDYFVREKKTIVAHMHWQDGLIERQIGLLCETARCLHAQLNEPGRHDLYYHALLESLWLSNRLDNPTGKTSYEWSFGKAPNHTKLIPYGCIGWAVLPRVYRYSKNPKIPELRKDHKSRPRAIKVKYLGHQAGKKGHKVLILSNGRVAVFATVYWDERSFGKCHIAGGLQIRKRRFRREVRKQREVIRTSKDLPLLFEYKEDIEQWTPPIPSKPSLGCSRCHYSAKGCIKKSGSGMGCRQKLAAWLEKYNKNTESGEESDEEDTEDSLFLKTDDDDSGSDVNSADDTDEEYVRTNPQLANALREAENKIDYQSETLARLDQARKEYGNKHSHSIDVMAVFKIAESLVSGKKTTNGEKGVFGDDYLDYLFHQDANLPEFTGYRNIAADAFIKDDGLKLNRDRCCAILEKTAAEMADTQVLKITDSTGKIFLVPVPDRQFNRVFKVTNGKETFSHFEYVNSMMETHFVPTNAAEALADSEWKEKAMFPEFEKLDKMGCFEVIDAKDLPEGAKLVSGKWVFRQKYDKDGEPQRKKGRYVARGFSCRAGIDYSANHTYSPVASAEAIRLMLNICAAEGQILEQADITNAYIINELNHEIYMPIPEGYVEYCKAMGAESPDPATKRMRLRRSLYGLPQSGFLFYKKLSEALEALGFEQCTEPCLFRRYEPKDKTWSRIAIYVDDLILGFSNQTILDQFKLDLENASELFEVKSLGPLEYLLGVHVVYDRETKTLTLDQERYIEKMFARFQHEPSNAMTNRQLRPMTSQDALMFQDPAQWRFRYPKLEEEDEPCDSTQYRAVIGSLLHAIKWTRNDCTTAVYYAATAMHRPTKLALEAAYHIVKYMYDTKATPITYNLNEVSMDMTGYCDSDLGGWHDGRSRGGWSIKLGTHTHRNAPFLWNCHLEKVIFRSTADAEQSACCRLGDDLVVYRRLATQLGFKCDDKLTHVYSDNLPMIRRIENPIRVRSKLHSKLRLMQVIAYANVDSPERILHVHHIPGKKNPSDTWTKFQKDVRDYHFCRATNLNLPIDPQK